MTDRDNLTTRDIAEPRSTGEETAEDMPLTREDHPDLETGDRSDQIDPETVVAGDSEMSRASDGDAGNEETAPLLPGEQAIGSSSGGTRFRRASSTAAPGSRAGRHARRRTDAGARLWFLRYALQARGAVGQRGRGRLDRRSPGCVDALPLILQSPPLSLIELSPPAGASRSRPAGSSLSSLDRPADPGRSRTWR